jgi:hypothetical protein
MGEESVRWEKGQLRSAGAARRRKRGKCDRLVTFNCRRVSSVSSSHVTVPKEKIFILKLQLKQTKEEQ